MTPLCDEQIQHRWDIVRNCILLLAGIVLTFKGQPYGPMLIALVVPSSGTPPKTAPKDQIG